MNSLALQLIDLLQMAETPLYSAYRWLGRHVGKNPSLSQFLQMVNSLIAEDTLRLWVVDQSQDRTELFEVPENLADCYAAMQHEDASYDPFSLSITLGPAAKLNAEPEWTFALQQDSKRFILRTPPGSESEVMEEIGRYFPDIWLSATQRRSEGHHVLITGSIEER